MMLKIILHPQLDPAVVRGMLHIMFTLRKYHERRDGELVERAGFMKHDIVLKRNKESRKWLLNATISPDWKTLLVLIMTFLRPRSLIRYIGAREEMKEETEK